MERGSLKAIPTRYGGCFFRSRLAARWATFFDALGVVWEYETEGFVLEGVGPYLPDFWLPQVRMWAEVKPAAFTEAERSKSRALARQSGFACLLLDGMPDNKAYEAERPDGEYWDYALTNEHGYVHDEGRFFSAPEDQTFADTEAAVIAARSARFEFGESGDAPKVAPRPLAVSPATIDAALRALYTISGGDVDRFMATLAKMAVFRHLTRESPELRGIIGGEVRR